MHKTNKEREGGLDCKTLGYHYEGGRSCFREANEEQKVRKRRMPETSATNFGCSLPRNIEKKEEPGMMGESRLNDGVHIVILETVHNI